MTDTKACAVCKNVMPIENFARKDKAIYKSGYSPICRMCAGSNSRRWNDGGYQGRRRLR